VCECELTIDLETRLLNRMKWTSKFSIDHPITNQFTARPINQSHLFYETTHPKNHNHGSRYKSSRLFQLTPNIQRVLARITVTCAPDIRSQKLVEGIT